MYLLKHSGHELPVYSEDDVAWTVDDIRTAAQSGEDYFVRRTSLEYDGYEDNLKSVLDLADLVLSNACELLEVKKVDHKWGFAPISETTRNRLEHHDAFSSRHMLLPSGLALVACVSVVTDATPLSMMQRVELDDRLDDYHGLTHRIHPSKYIKGIFAKDVRPRQFVIDPAKTEEYCRGITLVDIEPRLASLSRLYHSNKRL